MDKKLLFIITLTYLYGFLEIYMSMRQRKKKKIKESGDKYSIWILGIFIGIGYFLSFRVANTEIGRLLQADTFFLLGIILFSLGLVIRLKSIMTLKQQFTYIVTKVENHELIESGLYKYIRHPGYLGQIIIFLGISTSLSNWLSVLLMITSVLIGYIYRITIEEKFMTNQIGEKYVNYQKRTKKLIPFIY
jgi:protein-S-isoprenylcysteine O-methyltransferase